MEYKKGDDGEPTHLRYIIHNPGKKKSGNCINITIESGTLLAHSTVYIHPRS